MAAAQILQALGPAAVLHAGLLDAEPRPPVTPTDGAVAPTAGVIATEGKSSIAAPTTRPGLIATEGRSSIALLNETGWLSKIQFVESSEGPSHSPIFAVTAMIDGVVRGKGTGKTKKQAKEIAAAEVLGTM